jgi:hypothetical protein
VAPSRCLHNSRAKTHHWNGELHCGRRCQSSVRSWALTVAEKFAGALAGCRKSSGTDPLKRLEKTSRTDYFPTERRFGSKPDMHLSDVCLEASYNGISALLRVPEPASTAGVFVPDCWTQGPFWRVRRVQANHCSGFLSAPRNKGYPSPEASIKSCCAPTSSLLSCRAMPRLTNALASSGLRAIASV